MAENFVQLPKDEEGKKVRTDLSTISGEDVHTEVMKLSDTSDTIINPLADGGNVVVSSGAITETNSGAIKTAVEIIDNAISGNEMQVDIVASIPSGTNVIGDVGIEALDTPTTTALTLTTAGTAYLMPASELAGRKLLVIYNVSDTAVYIGSASVTTTNGIILEAGGVMNIDCESDLYAICGVAGKIVNILELS